MVLQIRWRSGEKRGEDSEEKSWKLASVDVKLTFPDSPLTRNNAKHFEKDEIFLFEVAATLTANQSAPFVA